MSALSHYGSNIFCPEDLGDGNIWDIHDVPLVLRSLNVILISSRFGNVPLPRVSSFSSVSRSHDQGIRLNVVAVKKELSASLYPGESLDRVSVIEFRLVNSNDESASRCRLD